MDMVVLIGFDTNRKVIKSVVIKILKFLPKMLVHNGVFKYFWRLFLNLFFSVNKPIYIHTVCNTRHMTFN